MNEQKITYQQAGVDIDAGDALVERITPLLKKTMRPGTNGSVGGFASSIDLKQLAYKDPILLTTTDGVGTKLKIAQQVNKHETIGIDLVAMCVNDLLVHGAEPISFLDYFATGKLSIEQASAVIAGIVHGCKQSNCALSGGETAEMPGMYKTGEYDLAGFACGIVERDQLLPKLQEINCGDSILGFASSGIHSNGYSLVRFLLDKNATNLFSKPPFESAHNYLYEVLLEPTKIYVQSLLPLIKENKIKALAHITGGGLLENIPRILPENLAVTIDVKNWRVPPIFGWLQRLGNIPAHEMIRTFNYGIGMIAIVDPKEVTNIGTDLKNKEEVFEIGSVIPAQNNNRVTINNLDELENKE